ncbi:10980_t:CDS:2, partial [Ambispora leptoticha]
SKSGIGICNLNKFNSENKLPTYFKPRFFAAYFREFMCQWIIVLEQPTEEHGSILNQPAVPDDGAGAYR